MEDVGRFLANRFQVFSADAEICCSDIAWYDSEILKRHALFKRDALCHRRRCVNKFSLDEKKELRVAIRKALDKPAGDETRKPR